MGGSVSLASRSGGVSPTTTSRLAFESFTLEFASPPDEFSIWRYCTGPDASVATYGFATLWKLKFPPLPLLPPHPPLLSVEPERFTWVAPDASAGVNAPFPHMLPPCGDVPRY
jgi:hypothetical protein